MAIEQTVETWLWTVAARKVALAVAKAIISIIVSAKVQDVLKQHGITVDIPTITLALPVSFFGLAEAGHDYLKLKTGWRWL